MEIILGLLIIAIGAFCQSSCYVPINRIKEWSWESYWIVQGVFAWLVFPFLGALLAVPADNSLFEIYANNPADTLWTIKIMTWLDTFFLNCTNVWVKSSPYLR